MTTMGKIEQFFKLSLRCRWGLYSISWHCNASWHCKEADSLYASRWSETTCRLWV